MAVSDDKFKPEGTLKKFLEVGKKGSRVLTTVERHLITTPEPNTRRSDVLHPSAMVKDDWCHRSSYFQLLGFPPPPSKYRITLSQKRVFQIGHDIHHGWQNIFKNMETLWGKWRCPECNETFVGSPKDHKDDVPPNQYEYLEVPLVYEPLRISGHADGILIGFGEPLLLEIKSIGAGTFRFEAPQLMSEHNGNLDDMWKSLNAPFMSHIKQAQMYMKLAELIGLEVQPQEVLFLYENKSNQQPKEFVVPKSDFGISHILEAAAQIVEAVDNKTPPTCNIDSNAGCYQCKGYDNVQA
jgi:hypothetical protein